MDKKRSLTMIGTTSKANKKKKRKKVRGGVVKEFVKDESTGIIQCSFCDDDDENVEVEYVPLSEGKWLRVLKPYPYSFTTFAKDRWIGQRIIDVYVNEFGSYPKCYYEGAIKDGRIFVNHRVVNLDYQIQRGDEICHVVHRHEPAVMTNCNGCSHSSDIVVYEDEYVLAVDKTPTLPIHPCGAYHFNSLTHLLNQKGNLNPVHRLDRLTSGIVILAKSTLVAQSLAQCLLIPNACHKYYITRVHGQFPTNLQQKQSNNDNYWLQKSNNEIISSSASENELKNLVDTLIKSQKHSLSSLLHSSSTTTTETDNVLWFYIRCSIRVSSHKDGTWECCDDTRTRKAKEAITAFAIVSYDKATNSSLLIAKPITGRTHQIRLHLQYIGHSILHDDLYPSSEQEEVCTYAPNHSPATSTDIPEQSSSCTSYCDSSDLLKHVEKSCVWCVKEEKHQMVENFSKQNQGIYLHALKYHIPNWNPSNDNKKSTELCLSTKLPKWAIDLS